MLPNHLTAGLQLVRASAGSTWTAHLAPEAGDADLATGTRHPAIPSPSGPAAPLPRRHPREEHPAPETIAASTLSNRTLQKVICTLRS